MLDEFWEASTLDGHRAGAFTQRILAFVDDRPAVHPFTPPDAPIPLRPVRDRLQRLFGRRRSVREFGPKPLRHRDLERILAATGPRGDGGRVIPEAGGLPAVHVYALVCRARGPLDGYVVRYDHATHAATPIGAVPPAQRVREMFLLDGEPPPLLLVFVLDLDAAVTKYGPRAGRFALQQVGHAAQNVGLRLAYDGLRGYLLGGGLDHEVLGLLGLAHTRARYAGALPCGR